MSLPRFSRAPDPPAFLIQSRDLEILFHIQQFGLITRHQIQRLLFTPSTTSACKRRLTLLYHHGYVGRIALPVRNAYGAARAVYFLERLGQGALTGAGLIDETTERFRRPDAPGELFLHHRLDVADVRVAFTTAARSRGLALSWWDETKVRRSGGFDVTGKHDERRLIPDGYFTLSDGTSMDGFAVEVDRATVPEDRMRRRFLSYGELASSGAYRDRLPCASLRVLTIVTERTAGTRLDRLRQVCEAIGGRSLFWFADAAALDGDVLDDPAWLVSGERDPRRLPLSLR
jgi:hypothetical protein